MRLCLSILLSLISFACTAQLHFENSITYTRKEGLSNNSISCFVKDSRGFLWIGTSEGLNRFDGNRFVSFFNDRNDKETLSGNVIFDMLQYQPGHLLIATDNGLSVFNTFSNSFENEKITLPALRRGSAVYVRSLFKDNQNRIYVNYSGEIDVFTNNLNFLYRLTDTPWGQALRGIVIDDQSWFQDSKDRIWLPSDNFGICIIDEKKQQVYSWKNNTLFPFMAKQPIRSFFYDEEKQQIWFSAWGKGLEKYDLKTRQSKIQYFGILYTGEGRTINSIVKRDNRFICCGGQGIYSLDPETMNYENIYKPSDGSASYSFINCHTTLNDAENIWIGTETKGFLQIPYHPALIREIPLPYFINDYTNFCTGIISSDSLLYFAYGPDGLVEVDQRNFKTQHYPPPFINGKTQDVFRICEDKKKNILIGTPSGFFLFDRKTKQYKRPYWLPAFTNTLNVQYIYPDSKGNIWFSFSNPISLAYYDATNDQFHFYENYVVNNKKIFDDHYRITRIVEDEKENIWMVSYQKGGIVRYNPSLNNWKLYPQSSKAVKILGDKEVNSICITGNTIWVGNTYGLGLVQYDYKKDSVRQFLRKDGLLSENILAISKDKKNNLFISTKAGLNYITKTNEIRSIIVNSGDIDWGFAYTQYFDTLHNQLILGLNDRIVIIKNNLWEAQSVRLNTYINSIRVNNLFYPSNTSLTLNHTQKNISIDFTSINYNKNASLVYAYKMDGIDKDWNIASQATAANYSNLAPGHYTFIVKVKYQSGNWGPVNNSLHIIIVAALWQHVWFWLLAGLLIALGIFFLMKKRINSIRKNAQLKQKLTETEMLALRSQMNPHFIFNCLNAIDNLIQTNQPDKATTYLARFAKLIRSLLESSKNNLVPFYKDFETLQLYLELEQFRANNKFSYKLNADEELLHGDYKVPPLIVQPFVENAIHHGLMNKQQGERKLIVTVSLKNNFIQYIISDNGVGRKKAMELKNLNKPEHRSYGIEITSERIQLHNKNGKEKDIVITDLTKEGLPCGTEVKLKMKADYS